MSHAPLKIANAQAFWGDRNDAASELVTQFPELDYLTLDYLAEVSLSILAQQRVRDPNAGYARDFVEVFGSLVPYWKSGGRCRLITNAGGLNPIACAHACANRLLELNGPRLKIAVVTGDCVLDQLLDPDHPDVNHLFCQMESEESIAKVRDRLITGNAYLGAAPLIEALEAGADIVITGRVADPSLTVAACVHHFQWPADDWNRWAAATVAGHLIECGVQVTGGISTDWLSVPDPVAIGFPVVEMQADGSFVVTKAVDSGGRVSVETVSEQLVYEIGNPGRYLSPDLTVSFLGLKLEQLAENRVLVTGAIGSPPSPTLKVSATYRDGYRAAGQLTIFGRDAVKKAHRCGEIVLERMRAAGMSWRNAVVECIGAGACAPGILPIDEVTSLREVGLRIALEAEDKDVVDYFTRQVIPLVTAGPQGTTGYAEGRPRVHPIFRYWPCLIDRQRVTPQIVFVDYDTKSSASAASIHVPPRTLRRHAIEPYATLTHDSRRCLGDIAIARSGDKGTMANIGVVSRSAEAYEQLADWLTAERVSSYLAPMGIQKVERFELPNLHALNFLIHGVLANGLRIDAQGKAMGQVLLEMPLDDDSTPGDQDE